MNLTNTKIYLTHGLQLKSQRKNKNKNWLNSEYLNTHPLVRNQVDFLVDKLIFQQLAGMGK